MKKIVVVFCITSAFFVSCVSTRGDISVSSQRDQVEANLTTIESAVVPLEAAGAAARSRQNEITSARRMISDMEREAAADTDFSGRLTAWSGRLAIIEGRYSEAQRLHRQSLSLSPANLVSVILGIRLEGDPSRRLEMVDRELVIIGHRGAGVGELNIERARSLMELNRFSEAAGAFDTAFASGINPVYSESYRADRNRAWELRNTSGAAAGSLDLLGRESITWNDCITLAKNETQLLRFITGGRDMANSEIFSRLLERSFIPSVQDITVNEWPTTRPNINETVTRAGAAWFIWRLYAEARADRGLLTRYSARYATGTNPRSPIADVPPLSPFFDSILGCVETEFLSLPDGRNFMPTLNIRGTELLTVLRRIN